MTNKILFMNHFPVDFSALTLSQTLHLNRIMYFMAMIIRKHKQTKQTCWP
jgi:hypothetical protein